MSKAGFVVAFLSLVSVCSSAKNPAPYLLQPSPYLNELAHYNPASDPAFARQLKGDEMRSEIEDLLKARITNLDKEITEYKKLGLPPEIVNRDVAKWTQEMAANQAFVDGDCTDKDLRAQFGPIRDQKDAGVCYAFAASDLISAKVKKQVSYLDLAVQKKMQEHDSPRRLQDLDNGDVSVVLLQAKKNGVCTTAQFPDDNQANYSEIKKALEGTIKSNQPTLEERCRHVDAFGCYRPAIPQVTEAMKAALAKVIGPQPSLIETFDKICEPREKLLSGMDVRAFNGKAETLGGIDEALAQDFPSAVSVRDPGGAFGTGHALLVVGRKKSSGGKCQYILRNSWGSCSSYGYYTSRQLSARDIKCKDGGYLYVDRNTLIELSRNSVYLK